MLIAVLLLALTCTWCNARLVNVTIDDTLGDKQTGAVPTYDDAWEAYDGNDARGPYAGDGLPFAHYSTLHCQTGYSSKSRVSLSFNGTAFYFFLIFQSEEASNNVGVWFTLDYHDVSPERLDGDPSLSSERYYQVVYKVDGQQNKQHTVDLTLMPGFESETPPACFDYAIYTTEAHAGAVADSEPANTQGNGTSPAPGTKTTASTFPSGHSSANTLRSVSVAVPLVGAIIAGIAGAW